MKKPVLLYFIILILGSAGFTCGQLPNVTGEARLQSDETDEVSGVVTSRFHKDVLYIHNDSGDDSRFFAIDPKGKILSILKFDGDPKEGWFRTGGVRDCEDIAIGAGPLKDKTYIYLADIGDNSKKRTVITLYRFLEPAQIKPEIRLKQEVVHLSYPDGPRDAETLLIDPWTSQLYIISKREKNVRLYTTPLLFKNESQVVLQKKGEMHLDDDNYFRWITGGDISADGTQLLIRSYRSVYYWKRLKNEPIEMTVKRVPVVIPCQPGKQAEAIGFTADGKAAYCISEGENAAIHYHILPGT